MQPFARYPQKAPQPGAFLHPRLRNRDNSGALLLSRFHHRYFPVPFLLVLAFFLLPLAALARTEGTTVRHVLDGDSVILADQRQVRLIGVNAPEFGKDGKPDEPLAVAARDRLRELVQGKNVRLELEEEQRDSEIGSGLAR